jgi:hypothetical protein
MLTCYFEKKNQGSGTLEKFSHCTKKGEETMNRTEREKRYI